MTEPDAPVPPLEMTVDQQGRWTVVRLAGVLDYTTCDALTPVLQNAVAAVRCPCVAVEFSGLQFCDSSGLRCVLIANRRIRAAGGHLVIVDRLGLLHGKGWMFGLGGLLTVVPRLPA